MRPIAAIVALILPACAAHVTAPDVDGSATVVWVRAADPNSVCREVSGEVPVLFLRLKGCAYWRDGRCHFVTKVPGDERDVEVFATMGHEVMHCFDGAWHDKWGKMTKREES